MDNVMIGEGSQLRDRHVEKLFSDLYEGTHEADAISLHNLNIYLDVIYGYPRTLTGFTLPELLDAAVFIGDIQLGVANDGERYSARYANWEDTTLYVLNADLAIVIALAIVQSMRHATVDSLNAGRDKQH